MLKKLTAPLFVFIILQCFVGPVFSADQTVFGPEKLKIGRWHFHYSTHRFQVSEPDDGTLIIKKNTPGRKIRGGFLILNGRFMSLRNFLRGKETMMARDIRLRSSNRLRVFLRGKPGASIRIRIRAKAGNPPPEVSFSAKPPTIIAGQSSTLTWTAAHADTCVIDPDVGAVDFSGSVAVSPTETTTYTLAATGAGVTVTQAVTVTVIYQPAVQIIATPETIDLGNSAVLTWSATHADTCVIEPGIGSVAVSGSVNVSPFETTAYKIIATGDGGVATASVTLTVIDPNSPPTVSISASPETISQGGSTLLTWTSTNAESAHIDQGVGVVPADGSLAVAPENTTTYTITVTGATGTASETVIVMVVGAPESQPEGSFGDQYDDLIPPDATVESYDPKRFSLITGLVEDLSHEPLADVSVTILNHPEYGTVQTNPEGRFSIPVEGGGILTLSYQKAGLLAAHRQVFVPWNDIAVAESIVMILTDPAATELSFDGNSDTVVTHRSTPITDESGSRSLSMVFAGDNRAYLVDKDGNDVHELTNITTRASEFTTPKSMPAVLPPNSAYTYCAELSVDGASRVRFAKPVISWVDNFLGFNVGEVVPVGYYDRDDGVWKPAENGVVVKLLDTDNDGIIDALDATGDDGPDDLNNNGSFSDEVKGLDDPEIYKPEATFWRVAISHFSPWDYNWPYGPPMGAIYPNPDSLPNTDQQQEEQEDCKNYNSSFVEERSRIFHEDIPVPGTGMTLHYASNRVEGYNKSIITVSASGDTVPDVLKKIHVKVEVAGRTFEQTLDPLPNQKAEFVWDGLDSLGRLVGNSTVGHVSIGFEYDLVYYSASADFEQSFAKPGRNPTLIRGRQNMIKWKYSTINIRLVSRQIVKGGGFIAEGWTLSGHHYSNMIDNTLYKGDGTTITNYAESITTVAGDGKSGYSGDGGPATQAQITPTDIFVDSEGNLYIADTDNHSVRKVDNSGTITTVAGNGTRGYSGDGGPATQAQIFYPSGVFVDSTGNLYIADINQCIRKVDTSGTITTVAGNGTSGYSGDGGPATQAQIDTPLGILVDSAGNLYISDDHNQCIRMVDTSGTITTVAGNGTSGYNGDGGPATEAQLKYPKHIAVDLEGNLYVADSHNFRIRKVDTSGIITTVAGNGTSGYSGDGGPASQAQLNYPHGVAVDSEGNLYIADNYNDRIRKVFTDGTITTVAGNGTSGFSGDGGPATQAQIDHPYGMSVDPAGNLYFASYLRRRIRKMGFLSIHGRASDEIVYSDENGLGYVMSNRGRQQRTVDLNTGVALYEFGYDEDNALISITDRFGRQITIDRSADGIPTAIISPDGLRTTLNIDADDHLKQITYADGSFFEFEYTPGGLMTAKNEPENNRFEHQFELSGKLKEASDQEGGRWSYTRTTLDNGDIQTEVLTAEGNLTTYLDHNYFTGAYESTITGPAGGEILYSQSADGLTVNKSLACGMDLAFKYGLDSEYKFKYVKEITESTPAALDKVTTMDKAYEDTNLDDISDLITETVRVNGKTTTLVNNVLQSVRTITSPEARTITAQYDPATLLTESVSVPGLYDSVYGYDPDGRLTSISTHTRDTIFAYNAEGFLESITDPEEYTTSYDYDAVGRITGINRPDVSALGFTYDKNGNMTVLTSPALVNHGFGFNKINLNNSYQTPMSGSYSYLYDKDRRLVQTSFPSGDQIDNIYVNGRLGQIQTPEGYIDFTYLCGTKVESITKAAESITYGYDGKLVTSETLSGTLNQSLSYIYNNDFNLSSFNYADSTVAYTYDDDGLLTGAGDFSIIRNPDNGLPDSVSGNALTLARTFNGYGEISAQTATINATSVSSWEVTRNDAGRITNKTETVNGVTSDYVYTYDPLGRLETVAKDGTLVEEYDYDARGTRIYEMNALRGISGRTLSYSDEDHLLSAGSVVYSYNLDGFLSTKTDGTEVTTYDYSSRGELLSVTLPDGRVIDYRHDPSGRRVAKIVEGVIAEKYLWQGLTRLLAVFDGNDNLVMRFDYVDGRMPVSMTSGGSTYYLTYDQVGSLRVVADASGNVVKKIDYDSFGNILDDTDPTFKVPFGFAGGLNDRDTGLVRFGYRDYDPDTGRWTAKDPISFAGRDTDLYGYCLSDPVNLIDPWGLYTFQRFLHETATYSGIAATASFLTPGGQTAAIVFAGVATAAVGLEIGFYSKNPFIDTVKMTLKMILPVKKPFDLFTDKAVDIASDKAQEIMDNKQTPCKK